MSDPAFAWNGARVARAATVRRALNFWRLREFTDDGLRIVFYRSRAGVVVLSVTAVIA